MSKWVALMPLRGGSKSIPGKNLRPIAGRPLFAWSLGQALASDCFSRVVVATDSGEIRAAVRDLFGDRVALVERSAETASDTAGTESVMLEFQAAAAAFDVLCLLQATSPLTLAADFLAARRSFEADNYDSLLTAVPLNRFLWSKSGTPLNYDPRKRPRRQDFDGGVMLENGAFYFTRAATLKATRCRLGGRVAVHPMPQEHLLEVDEPGDWDIIDLLLRRRGRPSRAAPAPIRALIVDVDGTLTDGGMYYGPEGESLKKFNTRDARGLARLRERGIRVGVISGERSPAVTTRMQKLGISDYHQGIEDKAGALQRMADSWGISLVEIAYVGDDTGDLACLRRVGLSCCPSDAVQEVRASVDHVCSRPGGAGAVREVCELILASYPDAPA